VNGDKGLGPRDYWWMILLYFAGAAVISAIAGLIAVRCRVATRPALGWPDDLGMA
jgi:uncharacterized membrane protein YhaH (DUF805 family)